MFLRPETGAEGPAGEKKAPTRSTKPSPGSPIALQSLPIYWVAYVLLDKKRVSLRGYVLHVHQ